MLQSFVVYGMFAFAMFGLGQVSAKRERILKEKGITPSFWTWDVIFALLIFAFVSGVRYNVGVDYLAYQENFLLYQQAKTNTFNFEPLFAFITNLMASSSFHFSVYFSFLAFLQIFFVYRAFKDQRYLYPFLGIIIILGPHYLSWMNGIRQMIVATVFVWSIQFIVNKDWKAYFITIALAALIHKSAVFLLPFYFLPAKDFFKSRNITIFLVMASLYIGNTSLWTDLVSNLNGLLQFIGYDRYSENLAMLIDETSTRNIGPRKFSMIMTVIIAIWLSPKLKSCFNYPSFIFMYNLAVAGLMLANLLNNAHHIFLRPVSYLTIFYVPIAAYSLVYLSCHSKRYFLMLLLAIICSLGYLPMSIIADNGKGWNDYTSYRFYWYYQNKN